MTAVNVGGGTVEVVQPSYSVLEVASGIITGTVPYRGEYAVAPTGERQTLPTSGRTLAQDITIEPIPSNYGLIAWNGSVLTVS